MIRHGDVALEIYVAAARRRSPSRRCTTASCSAGRGWSRRTGPCSTRARSSTVRAMAFDGALPARQVRARTPRSATSCSTRFAAGDRRAPPGHPPAAARRLRERRSLSAPPGPMVPGALPVVRPDAGDRGHLDARARAAGTRRGCPRSRPASSRCSTRSASARCRSRSAATSGPGPLVHTIRAVGAVTAGALPPRPGRRTLGVRGPFGTAWPRGRGRGRRRRDRRRRDRARAAAAGRSTTLLAHRERYGRVVVLYGGRSPGRAALPGRARALARALRRAGRGHRRPPRPPTGTGASAS